MTAQPGAFPGVILSVSERGGVGEVAQTCKVCKSKSLADIDGDLVRNRPLRSIAKQYCVSPASLFRHKRSHLPDKLALAKQHQDTLTAENLLHDMQELKGRLRRGLDEAEKTGNAAGFVAFARELRQTLESYFDISERAAEKATEKGANGRIQIRGVCERCGQVIDWEQEKRRIFQAVRDTVAGTPEGREAENLAADWSPPVSVSAT